LQVQKYNKKMGNEKRRKREHSKEKRFLRQDWAETVSRLQQGSLRTKKEFPFTGNSFLYTM
jgi:hypothetical protein